MKFSTILLSVALACSTGSAGFIQKSKVEAIHELSTGANCAHGTYKVYENQETMLCVGKVVYWFVVSLVVIYAPMVNAAASQIARWVGSTWTGSTRTTELPEHTEILAAEVWDEDHDTVTYGWAPQSSLRLLRDGNETSFIRHITRRYNKLSGDLVSADVFFDGDHDYHPVAESTFSKRDSRSTTSTTYRAKNGDEDTKLKKPAH